MNYKNYITNLNNYQGIDLYRKSGIVKVNIGTDNYIMKAKCIMRDIITLAMKLKDKKGNNIKLQKCYDENNGKFNVEILEISDKDLTEKKIDYINKFKSSLNYQLGEEGFTDEHRKHLSECKTGEKHNLAKLTEIEAIQIKLLALRGDMTSTEIGAMFNISSQQVRKIKRGVAWKHLVV
jgi:hypothetical protein